MDQEQDFRFSKREITHCLEKYSLPTPPSSNGKVSAVTYFDRNVCFANSQSV